MKNTLLSMAAIVFMAGSLLCSCQSSASKVEIANDNLQNSKGNVVDAQAALNNARKDTISDYQKFKKASEERIKIMQHDIADLKIKLHNDKVHDKAKYDKTVAELEQKISELKLKLEEYKDEGNNKWIDFKIGFNHDMDALGDKFVGLKNKIVNQN